MRVQIGLDRYSHDDAYLPQLLAQAHASGERANCLCTNEMPELVIAHVNGGYYLRRMPGTGQQHDPECAHFEIDPALSGRGNLEHSGAIQRDADSQKLIVKLGFSMSQKIIAGDPLKETGDDLKVDAPVSDFVAKSSMRKLSLRGLLDLIYEEAGLSRRYPAMGTKRFWGIVGREIKKTISQIRTAKQSNAKVTFVPQFAKSGEYITNNLAAGAFIDALKHVRGTVPFGYVVAQYHSVDTNYSDPRLIIRYCDERIKLPHKLYEQFAMYYQDGLEATQNEGNPFIVLARVHREGKELVANQLVGMPLDAYWLPVPDSALEARVIEELIRSERAFEVTLRHGAPREQVTSTATLLDTPRATAIYVAPLDEDEDNEESDANGDPMGVTLSERKTLARWHAIVRNEAPGAMIILPGQIIRLPAKRERSERAEATSTQTTQQSEVPAYD